MAVFLPMHAHAQQSDWSIDAFDSVIELQETGQLSVKETITTTFFAPHHGIFRTIPVRYHDAFNNNVRIGLTVDRVLQDGAPAAFSLQYVSGNASIKIGDAAETITGTHVYVIDYTVDRAVLFFDQNDELYWNVTGTEWDVPITHATATIRLPEGVHVQETSCYTGDVGSTATDCGIATNGNEAVYVANDYLTVAASFQKGIVPVPTFAERALQAFIDNVLVLVPIAIMLLTVTIWYVFGRDPNIQTVIAEYEPPDGLPALYVGTIFKSFTIASDFTAALIEMAVKGYLRIEVSVKGTTKAKDITLVALKDPVDLDDVYRAYFKLLFKKGASVTVADLTGSISATKMKSLTRQVKTRLYQMHIYTKWSFLLRGVVMGFGFLQLYAVVAFGTFAGVFVGIGFLFSALVTIVLGWFMTKRTLLGTEVARKIRGLKLFIHTAERYRVKWQEKEHIFEDLLPYAIAMNEAHHWASVFKDVPYRAQNWYVSPVAFTNYTDLTNDLTRTITTVTSYTAPHSSGSSGGGSSGGGFGGGGGGSW